MGQMKALLDTGILVDYLTGVPAAREAIARCERPLIGVVTWMESVAAAALLLPRSRRLNLADAIALASARSEGALLGTGNTRDYPGDEPDVRMPCRIPG